MAVSTPGRRCHPPAPESRRYRPVLTASQGERNGIYRRPGGIVHPVDPQIVEPPVQRRRLTLRATKIRWLRVAGDRPEPAAYDDRRAAIHVRCPDSTLRMVLTISRAGPIAFRL